jgi:tetratricopeptide (TPR) repeat protein
VTQGDSSVTLIAFREQLGRLYREVGASYRQLEARAPTVGRTLARSTVQDLLAGTNRKPRWTTVEAFVTTCAVEAKARRRNVPDDLLDVNAWKLAYDAMDNEHREGHGRTEQAAAGTGRTRADSRRRPTSVPRELPFDVSDFTGRDDELSGLDQMLSTAHSDGPPMIVVVSGIGGVGKTALAVRWASRSGARFPGGCVYADLRGYAPGEPRSADEVLARFLRTLGPDSDPLPAGADERGARYRTLLSGRRVLILLDNARDAAQVRPLLPGGSSCVVVVTSRDSLAGLIAQEGARRVELDVLPVQDGLRLLRSLVGERVDTEQEDALRLVHLCGQLPLALRIACERAISRPGVSLGRLADELVDEQRRLDVLVAGDDPVTAVRVVFSWSYRHLDGEIGRAFRLLSFHPGSDMDLHAAAALVDRAPAAAQRLLDALRRGSLIQERAVGRYAMHDLLRAYGRELAGQEDAVDQRSAALHRLFDYYQFSAAAAVDVLYPHERHLRPDRVPEDATPFPDFDDEEARAWLDLELDNLVAVSAEATSRDWSEQATLLSAILFRDLNVTGQCDAALSIHGNAITTARRSGDAASEAAALYRMGVVCWQMGDLQRASTHLEDVLLISREQDDRRSIARALNTLGVVNQSRHRYPEAQGQHEEAMALFATLGDRVGEGQARANLGIVYWFRGRYLEAIDCFKQDLAVTRTAKDRNGEAIALGNLGNVYRRIGRNDEALKCHSTALRIFERNGNRAGIASAGTNLGAALGQAGRWADALRRQEAAHEMFVKIGDEVNAAETLSALILARQRAGDQQYAERQLDEALADWQKHGDDTRTPETLNNYGLALQRLHRHHEAIDCHESALAYAYRVGDPYQEATALTGVASNLTATGRAEEARAYQDNARQLLDQLDLRP